MIHDMVYLPPFQPASPSKATSEEQLYSAIYDYTAADDDEVSFVEGTDVYDDGQEWNKGG